ncbi:MAG: ABC transporter permease [bacterium]
MRTTTLARHHQICSVATSSRSGIFTLGLLGAVLVGLHLVLARWLGLAENLLLFCCNLVVVGLGRHFVHRFSPGRFTFLPAGYLLLLVIVWLGAAAPAMFGLLAVVFAAAFSVPAMAGCVILFALCFYVLTPYAVPAFLVLTLLWLGLTAAGRRQPFLAGAYGLGFLLILLTLLPILSLVFSTSPQTVLAQLQSSGLRSALLLSLGTASLSALIVLMLGVPLAYVMVRHDFPGRRLLDAAIDLPILVPQSVAGIALLLLFGPKAPLGQALAALGIDIAGGLAGIVAAQIFVSSPFLVRSAMNAFAAVPERMEKSARSLGASHGATFFRVVLPLAGGGILNGTLLCWARAISEVGALLVLAYHPMTASIFIYDIFTQYGLREAQPAAAILVVLCLWLFLLFRWLCEARSDLWGRLFR